MKRYADIIIENRASQTDKPFTYFVNDEQIDYLEIGMRVIIPFGKGNKPIKGLVINLKNEYTGKYALKEIREIIDEKPIVNSDLLELSLWMSEYYISPYLDSINTVLPPGDFKKLKTKLSIADNIDINNIELNTIELEILNLIKDNINDLDIIKEKINNKNINTIIRNLENNNILKSSLIIETKINKAYENYIRLNKNIENPLEQLNNRAFKQIEIVEYLLTVDGEIKLSELLSKTNSSSTSIKSLEEKHIVIVEKKEKTREAVKRDIPYYKKHILNEEQKNAMEKIFNSSGNDFLLHGITGSGKTEVYLQIVEEMLKQGKDSIILVPEISLTPQTIDRFVGRFGDNVAVLHSRLSYGERFDQWRKIRDGEVKIVIGARSAIFAPFNNLGAIIIDEEHENTYKSSMNPKYSSSEVAKKRIEKGGILLRGSATPSLETYYEALNGNIEIIELNNRTNKKAPPKLEIIDMREELNKGNNTMFSKELYNALKSNLENNRQSILFLNRRGHSTFVSCRACGYVVKCDECDVSLTYHRKQNLCKCHYCGLTKKVPNICPECGSKYIRYFGVGTEQVEEFTRSLFPNAVIDRMDLDTVSEKDSYDIKLNNMKENKTDILIGTQMIAKGLDFSNVTLVGIITADTSLNLPDFRASEKTFQLITQVAGRAGRGELDGRVIVQTYTPEHFSINYSKNHDYKGFYKEDIEYRKIFGFPPFVELFSILIYGENLNDVKEISMILKEKIEEQIIVENIEVEIIGPYPSPLDKIKRNFRYQILFKVKKEGQLRLKNILTRVCIRSKDDINLKGVKYSIDISPISIL